MYRCGVGCYDQLCCPVSPKLLLGLDLGLGCDKIGNKKLEIEIEIENLKCKLNLKMVN